MRGRFAGLIVSAVLSIASIVLFFWPGLNYSIDFVGGVVVELRLPEPVDAAAIRAAFNEFHFGAAQVQQFGSPRDMLVKLDRQAEGESARHAIESMLAAKFPGTEIRRLEAVGARVSDELFRSGFLAVALSFVGVLVYIWFPLRLAVRRRRGRDPAARHHQNRGILCGHAAAIRPQFRRRDHAADRLFRDRQDRGLRSHPRESAQGQDNAATASYRSQHQPDPGPDGRDPSLTVLLSIVPLAVLGGEAIRGFALANHLRHRRRDPSSSIFIALADPALLLGQKRLRPGLPGDGARQGRAAAGAGAGQMAGVAWPAISGAPAAGGGVLVLPLAACVVALGCSLRAANRLDLPMAPSDAAERTQRPSPEALLEAAKREHRGRLKIFLGARAWRRQDL